MKSFLRVTTLAILPFLVATGCGVTYPKEKIRESILKLCKTEYKIDVDVTVIDNTLAIYLPLSGLFDITLSLSEEAQEKIQDVLLSASRIALSTDASIQFYCLIAQDVRIPEIQLVIIKYTEDIKHFFYQDISRGEFFERTIIDINENPQAKKEETISQVLNKMNLEKDLQDKILDDFFRSQPSSLEGIGYWNGKFYMKNITLDEFLAEQMASRIKNKFREEESLRKYAIRAIAGKFISQDTRNSFLIDFRAETLLFIIDPTAKASMQKEIFGSIFKEVSDVIYGYQFTDFDLVKITEKSHEEKLLVTKEDVYLFKKGKVGLDAILGTLNP